VISELAGGKEFANFFVDAVADAFDALGGSGVKILSSGPLIFSTARAH